MSEEYRSPLFKKWLDTLQQESWQLELIISGFALYALFSAFDPVSIEAKRAVALDDSLRVYFMIFLMASLFILILNLTIHVVLRGLWIGAIGLRYVSGEIEYDKLNYAPRFTSFLQKKVGSFDKFIADLEKYCSVVFAITFLTVFYILSLFAIIGSIIIFVFLASKIENDTVSDTVILIFLLVFILTLFIVFIDFVTQGWLKRNKWLSRIYFPVYRVFSVLSLSFIYRPIVYNLLDNKFGKRLAFMLVPLYLVILIIASLDNVNSNFIPTDFEDDFQRLDLQEQIASPLNYEDELGDDKFVSRISIPSKIIGDHYLTVFIPYNEQIEERLFSFCPELEPESDRRGFSSSLFKFESRSLSERRASTQAFLECFENVYSLKIDSISRPAEFLITLNGKEQSGLETVIPLEAIAPGKHLLTFQRKSTNDDQEFVTLARIPFWYYPD